MYKWILPSLSEILAENQSSVAECSPAKAERQWRVSLVATEHLLLNTLASASVDTTQGLVLAAPAPLFSQPKLTQSLQTVTFTAKPFNPLALMPFQMPDAIVSVNEEIAPHESVLSLLPADPLGAEQFCLVFTDKFSLVLVLATHKNGKKTFSFSFEPKVVQQAWRSLGARVMLANPEYFARLDTLVQEYSPVAPDCHIMIQFSQLLLQELTEAEETKDSLLGIADKEDKENISCPMPNAQCPNPDVELLQAFAHEVRTPLTTIRTMTRLLLKRRNLDASVINRLKLSITSVPNKLIEWNCCLRQQNWKLLPQQNRQKLNSRRCL